MEIVFGLLVTIPITLVTSTVFCVLAFFFANRWPKVGRFSVFASLCVLALLLLEATFVLTVGPFHLYQRLGAAYTVWHLIGFFLGPPAVGLLVLIGTSRFIRIGPVRVGVATVLCWFACMAALLGNFIVDEDIHGVDGSGQRPTRSLFPP